MYDVVIVGARCAGSALALMLAREGLSSRHRPRDVPERHDVGPFHPSGRRVLPAAARPPGGPRGARRTGPGHHDPGFRADRSLRPAGAGGGRNSGRLCAAPIPVRPDARRRRGRGGREPSRRCQLRRTAGRGRPGRRHPDPECRGATEDIRARLVVGADGKRSRLAKAVGAQVYDHRPAATCMYYAYWGGFDTPETRLFIREGLFGAAAATNDGLTFLGIVWPHAESPVCAPTSATPIARRQRRFLDRRPPRLGHTGRALRRHRRSRRVLADGIRSGLGAARRCRTSQGSDHRAGHDRRAARRRAPCGRSGGRDVGQPPARCRAFGLRPPPRRGRTARARADGRVRRPCRSAAGDDRAPACAAWQSRRHGTLSGVIARTVAVDDFYAPANLARITRGELAA